MNIHYDLATNFDDELIRRVAEFGVVRNLYGKLREDVFGGGRPNFALPDVSRRELEGHIALAHEKGMSFNYLLNALCMNNREVIARTNRQMREFVAYLVGIGVDSVTVGSPFLLRLIKETSPLPVCVSVYNDIDSLHRIKEWATLGANELTLHYSYNRNFRKLEAVLRAFPGMAFRLIANNVCLHECIYRANHAASLAHASQTKHESGGFFLDYYSLRCGADKLANPVKLLTADWIRPEDVHLYEELCDAIGASNLSLKLTERTRTTDRLVRVVTAYAKKRYDGNLFDVINFIGNRAYGQIRKGSFVKGAITGKAKAGRMPNGPKSVYEKSIYPALSR